MAGRLRRAAGLHDVRAGPQPARRHRAGTGGDELKASEDGYRSIEILLLTEQDCAFCEHAQQVVDRLSLEYPLELRTIELHSPEGEALAAKGGILFAPGVFVDGEAFSYGRLSERRLRRGLDRRA